MSNVKISANASGTGTLTIAAPNTNTDRTLTLPDNSGTIITSGSTTGIDASAISTGTVATARLATGTANNTTFLRGDQTWATAGGAPTTDQVLSATAGASVGAVGTYAFLGETTTTTTSAGGTRDGSNLRYAGIYGSPGYFSSTEVNTISGSGNGGTPAGTWRAMGRIYSSGSAGASIWLRIS